MPPAPKNVTVHRLSNSEMNVSWVPLTIVEARGFLLPYIIFYTRANGSSNGSQEESMTSVPANQSNTVIDGLEAEVEYDVSVFGQTNTGLSICEETGYTFIF